MANTQTSNVKTKNKNCQTERDRQTSTNALQEIEAALEDYTKVLEAPPLSPLSESTTTTTKQPSAEQTTESRTTQQNKNLNRVPPIISRAQKINEDMGHQ